MCILKQNAIPGFESGFVVGGMKKRRDTRGRGEKQRRREGKRKFSGEAFTIKRASRNENPICHADVKRFIGPCIFEEG